jgi:hypothetical protein
VVGLFDKPVGAESAEDARHLTAGALRKPPAQCLVPHTADGELISRQGHEQCLIVCIEEIEAAVRAALLLNHAVMRLSLSIPLLDRQWRRDQHLVADIEVVVGEPGEQIPEKPGEQFRGTLFYRGRKSVGPKTIKRGLGKRHMDGKGFDSGRVLTILGYPIRRMNTTDREISNIFGWVLAQSTIVSGAARPFSAQLSVGLRGQFALCSQGEPERAMRPAR